MCPLCPTANSIKNVTIGTSYNQQKRTLHDFAQHVSLRCFHDSSVSGNTPIMNPHFEIQQLQLMRSGHGRVSPANFRMHPARNVVLSSGMRFTDSNSSTVYLNESTMSWWAIKSSPCLPTPPRVAAHAAVTRVRRPDGGRLSPGSRCRW
jgi:hypothetical protein